MAEDTPMDVDMASNFDLEAHVAGYAGHAKARRLIHVYQSATDAALRHEALRSAVASYKDGVNVDGYKAACEMAQSDAAVDVVFDTQWANSVQAQSSVILEKLEDDLNAAKSNGIREVMRQTQMDIGKFHHDRGDFSAASKMFMRTREYCATCKQTLTFCLGVIKTYACMSNWSMVSTYVQKAESLADVRSDDAASKQVCAQLKAASGLAALSERRFRTAALSFSAVGPDLGAHFAEIIAPQAIALYGALCGLAEFDRSDVKRKLLTSSGFVTYMESVPQVRELLEAFCASHYAEAFRILDCLRPTMALDEHLAPHLSELTQAMRCRALCEYVTPFKSLRLADMAEAIGTDAAVLEAEMAAMIMDGKVHARIDSHNKNLYKLESDQRRTTAANLLDAADTYIANAHALLLRNELIKAQLRPVLPEDADMHMGGGGDMGGHALTQPPRAYGSRLRHGSGADMAMMDA